MGYFTQKSAKAFFLFGLFITLTACDAVTPGLLETDENGKVIDNRDINIQHSLANLGLKGYAIDSMYTQLEFDKYKRITKVRKGIVRMNGMRVDSIVWTGGELRISYNGGSTIVYVHNGIRTEITLNSHSFAEVVESKYTDGSFHSRILYSYNSSGYLERAELERYGKEKAYLYYNYSKEENFVLISEPNETDYSHYRINLLVNKNEEENTKGLNNVSYGYVCNVLNFGNAPLTNDYVIIPDLYFLGIYGTPVKNFPNDQVEMGVNNNGLCISRIGKHRFFY